MTRSWFRKAITQRVRIHTRDDQSIEGLLRAVYAQELVLEHARHISSAGEVEIEGAACVPRSNIAWVQLLTPES